LLICVGVLCALPATIWEFKSQGFSQNYTGERQRQD
jgi:hypothetical protein